MSVFKEEIRALEDMIRHQVYIFKDEEGQPESADKGLFDTKTLREDIQDIISTLPDGNTETIFDLMKKPIGRRFKTAVAWEMDSQECTYTTIEICWYTAQRKKDKAYFTIDLQSLCGSTHGFKEYMKKCGQNHYQDQNMKLYIMNLREFGSIAVIAADEKRAREIMEENHEYYDAYRFFKLQEIDIKDKEGVVFKSYGDL